MTTHLIEQLRAAVQARQAAEKAELAAIIKALTPGSGIQQKAVVEATGYSREHIRRIARDHGIGPAKTDQ
ncbi:hypothetical protein J5X84_36215 [Streptosporangiaceae bacterium NEAU-GS5]|nr:hypothetical protein [Streptosporangiaceae bacterium NEAU-GS5]